MKAPRKSRLRPNEPGTSPVRVKTILVPCDFSASSRAALDCALDLAGQSAALTLLHVIEPVEPGFLMEPGVSRRLQGEMRQRAEHQLAELARTAMKSRGRIATFVKAGKPWRVIVDFARRRQADLIVMGTHGYTGLRHAWLGSVAERVARHAPCSVLTVRGRR